MRLNVHLVVKGVKTYEGHQGIQSAQLINAGMSTSIFPVSVYHIHLRVRFEVYHDCCVCGFKGFKFCFQGGGKVVCGVIPLPGFRNIAFTLVEVLISACSF